MLTGIGLAAGLTALMFAATLVVNGGTLPRPVGAGDFYAVVPHDVMIALFGGVFLFAVAAIGIGAHPILARHARVPRRRLEDVGALVRALRDVLTLRHLHGSGEDCTSAEETRTPWRRWFHHCTFYGFLFCFASTSVAAIYHTVFDWQAPYVYTSLPVVLGTAGGAGLARGFGRPSGRSDAGVTRRWPIPLRTEWTSHSSRCSSSPRSRGCFSLVLRERAMMSVLLIVHLGVVLALFLTLPYGKFVHGIYRTAALVKYAKEGLTA